MSVTLPKQGSQTYSPEKVQDWFTDQNFCNSDFSSEVPGTVHLTQLRMHFVEDTTSWLSAKTVWKFMQMRALEVVLKTGTKSIFRTLPIHLTCKTSVGTKIHATMQTMFYLIFLPYYCTSVKTVKCTIQRTSSADSLRKPFENPCRCAHLPTACVRAIILLISLTHWVRSLTTTRDPYS